MPNLPTHFSFALETLAALDDPSIQANLGSFLLGSTTPDIRARTKWKRSHTHFAPLSVERVGVGAEGLFCSNPHLTEAARKSRRHPGLHCGLSEPSRNRRDLDYPDLPTLFRQH